MQEQSILPCTHGNVGKLLLNGLTAENPFFELLVIETQGVVRIFILNPQEDPQFYNWRDELWYA
ncbi:MAG: hypothetical protein M0R49_12115, partial [Limnochordia bacterium]|nr:hypothetical protein [Limnochordia bacterium]